MATGRSVLQIVLEVTGGKQAGQEFSSAQKGLSLLKGAVASFGIALGVRELVNLAGKAIEASTEMQNMVGALNATTGSAAKTAEAIRLVKEETRGTVSVAQAASSANIQLATGLATSAEEAARLTAAGSILTGIFAASGATMEKFNRLLATGNQVLLDNFGLSLDMVNARQREIEAATGLGSEETRLMAVKALLTESADKYRGSISESTIASQQLQAAVTDLAASFGSGLAPATVKAQTGLALLLNSITSSIQASKAEQDAILANSSNYQEYINVLEMSNQAHMAVSESQYTLIRATEEAGSELELLHVRLTSYSAGTEDAGQVSLVAAMKVRQLAAAWRMEAYAVLDAENAHLKANNRLRDTAAYLKLGAESLAYQMGQIGDTGGGRAESQARAQMEQHNAELRSQQEETANNWETSMVDATQGIRSAIEGALQPTLQEVWTPGGEEGRIDEWARRTATLATQGFGSEWLTQLNTQFAGMSFWDPIAAAMQGGDEGALKAAATALLTGPAVTQLWDKELIKQRVREQLQQQNMRQELVDTIMQEMTAEGMDVGAGDVQSAMGGAPIAAQLAQGMGAGMPDAISGANVAPGMVAALAAGISANKDGNKQLAHVVAAGMMTYMGDEMNGVGQEMIAFLVEAVGRRLGVIAGEARP